MKGIINFSYIKDFKSLFDYFENNPFLLYYNNLYGNLGGDSVSLVWDGLIHNDTIYLVNRLLPVYSYEYYNYGQKFIENTPIFIQTKYKFNLSKLFIRKKLSKFILYVISSHSFICNDLS